MQNVPLKASLCGSSRIRLPLCLCSTSIYSSTPPNLLPPNITQNCLPTASKLCFQVRYTIFPRCLPPPRAPQSWWVPLDESPPAKVAADNFSHLYFPEVSGFKSATACLGLCFLGVCPKWDRCDSHKSAVSTTSTTAPVLLFEIIIAIFYLNSILRMP